MKRIYIIPFLLLFNLTQAQEVDLKDVESPDAIIIALYDVISGPAGEKRDWERMKRLFIAEGKLIPTFKNQEGQLGYRWWSLDEYIDAAGSRLEEAGFFEVEISRKIEGYGAIMHVFSTYESRRNESDEEPFARGINSIQLMNDGSRWWIVNVMWMGETAQFPLPEKYLTN